MVKKLFKSNKNKVILGVCGGLGEYFKLDPVLVRLIFAILIFIKGSGILLYLLSALIIPSKIEEEKKSDAENGDEPVKENRKFTGSSKLPHTDAEFDEFFKS